MFIGRDDKIWTCDLSHPNQPEGESQPLTIAQHPSKSAFCVSVTNYEQLCAGKTATILQPTGRDYSRLEY